MSSALLLAHEEQTEAYNGVPAIPPVPATTAPARRAEPDTVTAAAAAPTAMAGTDNSSQLAGDLQASAQPSKLLIEEFYSSGSVNSPIACHA